MVSITSSKTEHRLVNLNNPFEIGFYGEFIDDRSRYSSNYIKLNSNISFKVKYNKVDIIFVINDENIECHELDNFFSDFGINRVLIDLTSINVATLALLIKALKNQSSILHFLYVEPDKYSSTSDTEVSLEANFSLSESILGFDSSGVPTITRPLERNYTYTFLLGFEEERTLNALEIHDIHGGQGRFVFGVPAFKPHWDNESLRKNARVLKDFNLREYISYCGANDLKVCLSILTKQLYDSSSGLNIIPIGTKPHSLAAIILNVCDEKAHLLFDQPIQKNNRSTGVGTIHLYKVAF